MSRTERRHYIDNLRWMILLILIPYHAAMAWNVWGEPNYITLEGSPALSSIVVFFSPYFMPLLFVLAGVSTRFALKKRTPGQYLAERAKRLLVPLLFGTVVLMPVMAYIAHRFNYGYDGGFLSHYGVFFTKFTDLTGADGGFSVGQFWFVLYLFAVSAAGVGIISLWKKFGAGRGKPLPFPAVLALGLPLPLLSDVLSVGGKSLAEFTYLFLLGYFVFADESVIEKAEKYRWPLLCAGLAATVLNVYLFLWADNKYPALNDAANYLSRWIMIIALQGMAKRYLDFTGSVSRFMSRRSFLFYTWHFVWVVLFQYLLCTALGDRTAAVFAGTVIAAFAATFVCCEICIRIPFLCTLTGTKYIPADGEKVNQNK